MRKNRDCFIPAPTCISFAPLPEDVCIETELIIGSGTLVEDDTYFGFQLFYQPSHVMDPHKEFDGNRVLNASKELMRQTPKLSMNAIFQNEILGWIHNQSFKME